MHTTTCWVSDDAYDSMADWCYDNYDNRWNVKLLETKAMLVGDKYAMEILWSFEELDDLVLFQLTWQ